MKGHLPEDHPGGLGSTEKRKILYLQHAGSPGGSNNSLLFTLQALDSFRFEVSVAMAFPSAWGRDFYSSAGFRVIDAPEISVFRHTTAGWGRIFAPRSLIELTRNVLNWRKSGQVAVRLFEREKPDLVHLNSVILAPVAAAFLEKGIPFVWHVRESPVKGYIGIRFRVLRNLLLQAGNRVIFISEADRRAWVDDQAGTVIRNFIDLERFRVGLTPDSRKKDWIRGKEADVPIILYLGGFHRIKGIYELLEALRILKESGVSFHCVMAGALDTHPSGSKRIRFLKSVFRKVNILSDRNRARRLINKRKLRSCIRLLPFEKDIPRLLSASDLLIFPSTVPHFARPVIEAAGVGVPAVGSRLGGVEELIVDGETGILVPAKSPKWLAAAISSLLDDPHLRRQMGKAARQRAEREYSNVSQVRKIEKIYETVRRHL